MYFYKLYSESGFIRNLAFKKLFLETPEFLTFVYEYSLQLLGYPFDDTIALLLRQLRPGEEDEIKTI